MDYVIVGFAAIFSAVVIDVFNLYVPLVCFFIGLSGRTAAYSIAVGIAANAERFLTAPVYLGRQMELEAAISFALYALLAHAIGRLVRHYKRVDVPANPT